MTCKDCIHYIVCDIPSITNDITTAKGCGAFKNKADYVEVVRCGEWTADIQKITTPAGIEFDGQVGYKCSVCGRTEISREPYCNCGAKMDG